MDEIVAVSNGHAVKMSNCGARIDRFDQVVRFNGWVVEGFQRHCGSKTTIWSRTPIVPDDPRLQVRRLLFVPQAKRRTAKIPKTIEVIPPEVETRIRRISGMKHECWPTTGLATLAYLLRRFEVIHTVGWLKGDAAGDRFAFWKHYFPTRLPSPDAQTRHDLRAEARLFRRWIRQGRIIELDR